MAEEKQHDLPTLVTSLQASTLEWSVPLQRLTNSSMKGVGVSSSGGGGITCTKTGSRYLRYMQVLQSIEELFADIRVRPSTALVAWCSSLQHSDIASHFIALLVDHILQGILPYVALQRCLRLADIFLGWVTRPNAGSVEVGIGDGDDYSCPVLVPSHAVVKWIEQTWATVTSLSRDNAGSSSPTATASLCGALQLLIILLRWNVAGSPLPPFRRAQLPHPVYMLALEPRLLALRVLPSVLRHQADALGIQTCTPEIIEYLKKACIKATDLGVRIAAGSSLRGLLEAGLRVSTPTVAYALMDMLLDLCDKASLHNIADEELHDVGVAMGYLFAFYQCDFTMDVLANVLQASTASMSKSVGGERVGHRSACGSSGGRVRWHFFGGSDAVEGSRVVQRSFNKRMTRTAQRALAKALATLCSCCTSPATTADAIQCCFVLLVPLAEDARAYMPRLLVDAIITWARQLPSNGHRLVLADALRGYIQRFDEDKTVVRTAMVALKGVMQTLTSSLEIGFNIAEDVLAAVQAIPSLFQTGVEVLAAVARTNVLYARHLQHKCVRVDWANKANTFFFQLHMRALLDAASSPRVEQGLQADALGEEDRVSLIHLCIQLLLYLRHEAPPCIVQDGHYRQAELVFRLTRLLYDLLHESSAEVLAAIRDEVQPYTLGLMNLLVSSPATSIAFDKAVAAACVMLQRAPALSDMERMLAVGFLEARLTSQCNSATQDSNLFASAAATAYFAVSRSSLFELIYSRPWLTCSDDSTLRWLAAQALKDVATACALGVPVFSFADACGATVAAAAQSLGLLHADFLPCTASEQSSGVNPGALEIPLRTVEECGGKAVRLRRWMLHHFAQRTGATGVCVELLSSLRTDLYEVYATPDDGAVAESAEGRARRLHQRNVAMWNCLCSVEQLLQEASLRTAEAVWQNGDWLAEVAWWQSTVAQLVPVDSRASVEVRLLAAKVLGRCLVSRDQVERYTSQTVSAAAQALANKTTQFDVTGALMALIETHSCYRGSSSAAISVENADSNSSPTLPLVTSLLAEAWKQLVNSGLTATTTITASVSAPLLIIVSLRLAETYPAEVEAALLDNIVAVLLVPMTAASRLWWSPESVLGVFTALQHLWAVFPGSSSSSGMSAVQHGTALALLQQSHATALEGPLISASSVVAAALDALHIYTLKQQHGRGQAALMGIQERFGSWHALLCQSLDHITSMPQEEANGASPATVAVWRQSAAFRRRVVRDDDISRRLAILWRLAMEGTTAALPSTALGNVRLLRLVDVSAQVDAATAATTRKEWVSVAESLYASLLSQRGQSTPLENEGTTLSLKMYLDGIRTVLQARPPNVQLGIVKRDTVMFVAVEEADAAGTVRGCGGGDDSDNTKDYAEEYSKEGADGILSETGGGGNAGGERGPTPGDFIAGGGRTVAVPLNFDVAAKEAAMWLLYGLLRSINASRSSPTTGCEVGDGETRRALLSVVVAAAQLVEVHPEVQISTIAVLREVLAAWGDAAQRQGNCIQAPVLLQWKTQLVVGLTTVLQHGLLSLEGCTELAVQYSRCNIADQNSCRRVMRSLLLLLHACQRLHERGHGFLLVGGCGAGHIIVTLAKVAQAPAMNPTDGEGGGDAVDTNEVEKTQRNIMRSLMFPPCQAALTLQCELLLTAVSLANGHVQCADTIGLDWRGTGGGQDSDDDSESASATPPLCASRMLLTAGDVLQAVVFLTQEPVKAALGPALRYASGCLAVLVLSTLALSATLPPSHDVCPPPSIAALMSVVVLSTHFSASHQHLLAQLAQQRLCARIEKHRTNAPPLHSVWGTVDTGLLRLVTVAPVSRDAAATLLDGITPVLSHCASSRRKAEVAVSLLCVGMAASLELDKVLPLLTALSVQSLLSELPHEVLARLHQAVRSYVRKGGPTRARALALASPAGLLLAEQGTLSGDSAAVCSPFLADHAAWPVALQLLQEACDPIHAVTAMWSSTPSGEQPTPSSPALLRDQVPRHRFQAEVLLAILASLGASSVSNVNTNEAAALVVLRCGNLMSELLLGMMISVGKHAASPSADALHTALAYVVAVMRTPLRAAYSVALRPVGVYLLRTVATSAGLALRGAIQRLGPTKAMQLRSFMEESCA
ncbi:hypothetical protein JKF63_06019 [Porcisia hertigi]|uniref:Uncharacterized protein n=1 Tax=Porcisia hertigi TaxID=2761500 RepID=A0A836IU77_9TRYP|nr:hypothetical protein JKF63_06019 [Porcisia hertigi]